MQNVDQIIKLRISCILPVILKIETILFLDVGSLIGEGFPLDRTSTRTQEQILRQSNFLYTTGYKDINTYFFKITTDANHEIRLLY